MYYRDRTVFEVVIKQDFFQHETPEMSYVLGFLLSDGGIEVSGGSYRAYVANTNCSVIDYIQSLVGGTINKMSYRSKKNGVPGVIYRVHWHRKSMVKDLQERYGLTHNKSYTGTWPKVNPENEPHLIRGFLDGDGYICNGRKVSVEVSSASKLLMEGFADAVYRMIGKRNKVYVKVSNYGTIIYRVSINGIYAKRLLEKVYFCGWGLKTSQAQKIVARNILTLSESAKLRCLREHNLVSSLVANA